MPSNPQDGSQPTSTWGTSGALPYQEKELSLATCSGLMLLKECHSLILEVKT